MDIERAYSDWVKLRDWNLGPTIRVHRRDLARFRALTDDLDRVMGPLHLDTSQSGVMHATSPWHAAFFLAQLQHESIKEQSEYLLFRGQQRSSWPLEPSIDREPTHEQWRAILESTILCHLMTKLGRSLLVVSPVQGASFDLRLPPEAHMPVAQHYELKTPLLDFTTDPAVAVYFASRDEADSTDEFASVFVYQATLPAGEQVLNLRLPPPFIERPYRQKGIYIELTKPGDLAAIIPPHREIRFPVRAANHRFAVVRENVIDLLPQSREIDMLKALASAGVSEFAFDHGRQLMTASVMGTFAATYARRHESLLQEQFRGIMPINELMDQYVDRVEDMLYWLCYIPAEDGLLINERALEAVVASNPEIFRMMLGIYRHRIGVPELASQIPEERVAFMTSLIGAFEAAMTAAGHDHSGRPDVSKWFPKSN